MILAPSHELMGKRSPGRFIIDDPIVLQPVSKDSLWDLDGFLIVTAWGDEAADTRVTHSKNN